LACAETPMEKARSTADKSVAFDRFK